MDVARLNFSHGEHADHEQNYRWVRKASDDSGRAVGVLADLQGPKIRLGRFATGSAHWATGEQVRITVEDVVGTRTGFPPPTSSWRRMLPSATDSSSTTARSA